MKDTVIQHVLEVMEEEEIVGFSNCQHWKKIVELVRETYPLFNSGQIKMALYNYSTMKDWLYKGNGYFWLAEDWKDQQFTKVPGVWAKGEQVWEDGHGKRFVFAGDVKRYDLWEAQEKRNAEFKRKKAENRGRMGIVKNV